MEDAEYHHEVVAVFGDNATDPTVHVTPWVGVEGQ